MDFKNAEFFPKILAENPEICTNFSMKNSEIFLSETLFKQYFQQLSKMQNLKDRNCRKNEQWENLQMHNAAFLQTNLWVLPRILNAALL